MKAPMTTGLVCAGGVNQSFLARTPALIGGLGPIKGSSLRVSRRIANSFRLGSGVDDYIAFKNCGLILISVPEANLDTISAQLAGAVPLQGRHVVLCDLKRDSFCPSPLRTSGARVATLNCLPESQERTFVAEGNPALVARLRKLLAQDRRKLIELEPVTKPLYWFGVFLGGFMPLPWIAGAVESLRAAGFSREEATNVVEEMTNRAVRGYTRAGNKAWNRAEGMRLHQEIRKNFDTIRFTDSRLAALYLANLEGLLQIISQNRRAPRTPRHAEPRAMSA